MHHCPTNPYIQQVRESLSQKIINAAVQKAASLPCQIQVISSILGCTQMLLFFLNWGLNVIFINTA